MKTFNPFSDDSGRSYPSTSSDIVAAILRAQFDREKWTREQNATYQSAQQIAEAAPQMFQGLIADQQQRAYLESVGPQRDAMDPRMNPVFQAQMSGILSMLQSGNPDLQKAALSNFDNQFNATVPKAPEYTDPVKMLTDDIKEYTLAKQQGFPGSFQDWVEFTNTSRRMQVNVGGTSINNYPKADDKYLEERGKGEADAFNQLTAGADSAYKQKQSLDQFITASANGFEGGAADMLSGVANLFTSFGLNFAPEQLTDTRLMEQAVGNILSTKMAELGARGLTDKDMQILREALPRVQTDKASRVAVAQVLQKVNDATISQYKQRVEHEKIKYPDNNFYYHPWLPDWKPGITQPTSPAPAGGFTARRIR